MEARELRLGNWFFGYDKIERQVDVDFFVLWGQGIEVDEIIQSFIPLTEEWLLKFGFVSCMSGFYRLHYMDDYYFSFKVGGNYVELCVSSICGAKSKCKYVHQLQNLYFALVGEELTIKQNVI